MASGTSSRRWRRALITGASSGIGEAMAVELLQEGTDVVAVARRADRLEALAERFEGRAGCGSVEVLTADLADFIDLGLVAERVATDEDPVDLVVNNAGFGTAGKFWELPLDGELDEVALNVSALVHLTHAALGRMVRSDEGTIINVSSLASYIPSPNSATYAATKAYVTSFSEALHEELRGTDVVVNALLPGFTRTEFTEAMGGDSEANDDIPDFAWMTAEAVAAQGLAAAAAGKALCVPGTGYKALAGFAGSLPRSLRRRFVGVVNRR